MSAKDPGRDAETSAGHGPVGPDPQAASATPDTASPADGEARSRESAPAGRAAPGGPSRTGSTQGSAGVEEATVPREGVPPEARAVRRPPGPDIPFPAGRGQVSTDGGGVGEDRPEQITRRREERVDPPEPPAEETDPTRRELRGRQAARAGAPRMDWARLGRAMRPRASRAQVSVALLCALVGFGVVTQVQQNRSEAWAGLRQTDLVQLVDDLNRKSEALAREETDLTGQIDRLASSAGDEQVARAAAARQAEVDGVLAGTLPVTGPGLIVTVGDPGGKVGPSIMLHMLEELRNAGAESIEVSGRRLTADSWFAQGASGVVVDGVELTAPYVWRAIGDPETMDVALTIPGGALASVRTAGGGASSAVTRSQDITITAVKELKPAEYATPIPVQESDG